MYFFFESKTGHLVTLIWDIVWMVIDLPGVIGIISYTAAFFHWYKAAEILFALWTFSFVSVVRPLTYFILKRRGFSAEAINCVVLTRIITLVMWLLAVMATEAITQITTDTENSWNLRGEYDEDFEPWDSNADKHDAKKGPFAARIIILYFFVVAVVLINLFVAWQIKKSGGESSSDSGVKHTS